MSFSKNKVLEISNLKSNNGIAEMDEVQFDQYCRSLLSFVETFPAQETELKEAFSAKNYGTFSQILEGIRTVLMEIRADGLELSCRRLLEELEAQKYSIVEAHLTYLLAEISSLSIDIQMAQYSTAETPSQSAPAPALDRQKTILGVDDVSLLLMGLKSILQSTEYKFTGVNSGEAALRYVEKFTPDLFILDIDMPVMNGYELTRKLRARGQKAPIIFLTGNATKEYVCKALELGAADFIVKPVNPESVVEKIRKCIG